MKHVRILAISILATFITALQAQPSLQQFEGQWTMPASPFEGGTDEISFTASMADHGQSLKCHADRFMVRNGKSYPMDWTMTVEQDGEKLRIGWLLDAEQPASTEEFQQPASHYALFGADPDGSHRYIYLLSENIETQKLEPLTLWSEWMPTGSTTFSLPKTQQIYAVVSKNRPYDGAVGYIDIWASTKLTYIGQQTLLGDVNGDGKVDVSDVVCTVNYLLKGAADHFDAKAADTNGDNVIDVADVTGIVRIIRSI